jgi:hypothetical protein
MNNKRKMKKKIKKTKRERLSLSSLNLPTMTHLLFCSSPKTNTGHHF